MQILSDLIMKSLFWYFAIRRYDDSIINVMHYYNIKMLTCTTITALFISYRRRLKTNINRTKCLKKTNASRWQARKLMQSDRVLMIEN